MNDATTAKLAEVLNQRDDFVTNRVTRFTYNLDGTLATRQVGNVSFAPDGTAIVDWAGPKSVVVEKR